MYDIYIYENIIKAHYLNQQLFLDDNYGRREELYIPAYIYMHTYIYVCIYNSASRPQLLSRHSC